MEPNRPLLLSVVALAAWTFVMWAWMFATRIPAIRRQRIQLDATIPRGEQMAALPPEVRWKADNYNHLFEQPTVFYAVVIVAALVPGFEVSYSPDFRDGIARSWPASLDDSAARRVWSRSMTPFDQLGRACQPRL
jgi:hypothetical protein